MVRRVDRQGDVLIWCRKCSGYARQRTGRKLKNCCKPEQAGTKEHDKMLKRIQVLEFLHRMQKIGKPKGKKGGSRDKSLRGF